jgi:DNA polymerase V
MEKRRALMKALDAVNDRYGSGTLLYARQGLGGEDWRMQRRLMSPRYTTRWDHLPRVN